MSGSCGGTVELIAIAVPPRRPTADCCEPPRTPLNRGVGVGGPEINPLAAASRNGAINAEECILYPVPELVSCVLSLCLLALGVDVCVGGVLGQWARRRKKLKKSRCGLFTHVVQLGDRPAAQGFETLSKFKLIDL